MQRARAAAAAVVARSLAHFLFRPFCGDRREFRERTTRESPRRDLKINAQAKKVGRGSLRLRLVTILFSLRLAPASFYPNGRRVGCVVAGAYNRNIFAFLKW